MYKKSLDEFSALAFSKDPVPGGGGVSASAGALAASLAGMVTNLTIGKKKYLEYTEELEKIKETAETLRVRLLEAINDDANAFYPLSQAYSMDKESEGYAETLEKCLKEAARPPFMIMGYCASVIDLDYRLATIGSKLAVSDAGTSVSLALGALKGAYLNVLVNTKLMKNKEVAEEIETKAHAILHEYEIKANQTYEAVIKRL
ncbi:MAG: cyclodeaminase/cyclohydrolase family protein [Erysipelotrichaceae bacterium]|nr:cyclodeaminase/cyclohydrolase family protein [Erysipelotrichaceae bacterium]